MKRQYKIVCYENCSGPEILISKHSSMYRAYIAAIKTENIYYRDTVYLLDVDGINIRSLFNNREEAWQYDRLQERLYSG